jgi:hypothetical protein
MADSGNPTGTLLQEGHGMTASEPQQSQHAKRPRRARAKSPPLPIPSTPLMTRASKRKATENLNSTPFTFAGEGRGSSLQVVVNVKSHLNAGISQTPSSGPHHPRITFKKRKMENDSISTGTEEPTSLNITATKLQQAADNSPHSKVDSEAGPSTRSKKPKAAENASSSGDAQVSKTLDVPIISQPTTVQASSDKPSKNTSASATNWRRRMRKQEREREALENAELASSSSMEEASQASATVDSHGIEQLVLESSSASTLLTHAVPGVSAAEGSVDEQPFDEVLSLKSLPPSASDERGWGSKDMKISTSASSSVLDGSRLLTPIETTRLEDRIGDGISRASSIVSTEVPRAENQRNGSIGSATPSVAGKQDIQVP